MAKTLLLIFFFCTSIAGSQAQTPSANHDSIPRAKKDAARAQSTTTDLKDVADRGDLAAIFPNPASSIAYIKYNLPVASKSAKIVIYNILGSISQEVLLPHQEGKIEINTGQLSPGVYFYSLEMDGVKQSTKRLVIKH
jgi:hypothetical protein